MKKKAYNQAESNANDDIVSEPMIAFVLPQSTAATRTIALMGMQDKKTFAGIRNENDLIDVIRTGLPRQVMTNLMEIADITLDEMASIVHTSDRTLRRYTAQQKLSQEQSERMIELARLYSRGEEVFGLMERFKEWMDTTLLPFGNKKPKSFLDTSLGINMIMDELGRIEHGVFA